MISYAYKFLQNYRSVFVSLIFFDVLILLLHVFLSAYHPLFHLDHERNLPTLYQSLKLILFGFFFFAVSFSHKLSKEFKGFMFPLAVSITLLGFDEMLQIHENIYRIFEFFDLFHPSKIVDASMKLGYRSSLWMLYYLPIFFIFIFWIGYWVRFFQSKLVSNFWVIIVSCVSLFSVLCMEILSSAGTFSDHTYFWMITLEEVGEMLFASTIILVGLKVLHRYLPLPSQKK